MTEQADKVVCLKIVGNITASFSELAIKEVLAALMIVSSVEISHLRPKDLDESV